MSRFCFCNCPAGFSADPERHAPDCPGRSGAGKARTPVPATKPALAVSAVEELDAVLHWRGKHTQAIRERDALQQRLTAADERADSFDRLYTSSLDERDQLQQRADVLEELLRRWLSRHAMGAGTDSMVIAETIAAVGVPALKPAGKAAGKLPNIGAIWERNGRTITISPEPEHVGPAAPWVLTLPTALKPAEGGGDD